MKSKHLETIVVFIAVLVIVYLFTANRYYLYAGLGFAAIGLLVPSLSRLIHTGWMKLAMLIGLVMNKVLLSVVFFLVLTPVALLSRLFRKDPFETKKAASSNFTDRDFTYTKKSLEEVW